MTVAAKPGVCLVDADADFRTSFRTLLKSAGLPCVTCASAEELDAALAEKSIGCLVLEARLPGVDGLKHVEGLRQRQLLIPVIVVTVHADVSLAVRAMRQGAQTVLEKPCRDDELLSEIRQALGRFDKLQLLQVERQIVAPRLATLTPRELEVLDLMVAGKKNKLIAQELGISTKTLDIHRANIMRKMQTKTVADLVRWRLLDQVDPFAVHPR